MSTPRPVVVMGVSGSGKTTVGRAIAERLGREFVEGDRLHPEANVRKMAAGVPLDDADREPWLDAVAAELARGPVVVTCSALKRAYRDRLRRVAPDLRIVYLHGSRELLESRVHTRAHEYMPASLLDSQLATLEEPEPDEDALAFDVALRPDEIAELAAERLEKE
jgi:carbohydrate kinase (thermoresistant glucokinase family)